jgi:TPP-dependent pyruvate/acetoin dehydrogenase alpha subunit
MKIEDYPKIALELLRRMKLIRTMEETIAERYPQGKMRCPTHLSIGQEAVAAAAGLALKIKDQVVSTHRSHAHYIGKGGDLKAMMAELYGKKTGCSSGRGGSMHLIDLSVGYLASTAIVGNSIPIGVGAALSNQILKNGLISCVFIGDAAVETGVFHESANFAALKKLPVLFICENNFYSVYTHLRDRQPEGSEIWKLAAAHGLESKTGDGNDAWEVYSSILDASHRIREGGKPIFLEFQTYRWREHCGPYYDNELGYRSPDEIDHWKARDPILKFENLLLEKNMIDSKEIKLTKDELLEEVEAAFQFAEKSEFPSDEDAYTLLFKD